ncbi:MAG: hypothetical protein Q8P57_05380 [Candidatus Pacearchaeota archaeon]|nr:hypothetical protein [Candidatus Pacearchaeota archaeon]
MESYDKIIGKIARISGLKIEEVEEKISAKRTKLSGLISKEGAAQIVAAELGISFDNELCDISDLNDGMRKANVLGKITKIFPVREFNKNGREGKVVSFYLGDKTSSIRTALWDVNHISLIEKGSLKEGDVVEISGANVRNGELHLSGFSNIKKSKEKLEDIKTEVALSLGTFNGVKAGDRLKVRAVVVQSFEPRYFDSKKKEGEKGVLLNLVLDDGTETMRTVLFGETIKKIVNVTDEELFDLEKFNGKREALLGMEKVFLGNFRNNSFTNSIEMTANDVEDVNVDEVIKELEARV